MSTGQLVPQIRFKGFKDSLNKIKFIDFAPLQRGFDLPNRLLKKGKYPVVYSNGILNNHYEYKVKGPGVVTGRSGTIGNVTYIEDNFWPHNTALWVTDFKDNYPLYVYYFLYNFDFLKLATGSTVPTLNRNVVHSKTINIPSTKEQAKIGQFFQKLDRVIELQESLLSQYEQYKKAMLQKMFPKDGESEPEIRFEGFSGEWVKRRLANLSDVRDGTHDSPKYTTKGYPLITSKNLKDGFLDFRDISLISEKDYHEINKRSAVSIGDIIFGMIGTIGNPVLIRETGFAIKNVALIKEGNACHNSFLIYFLCTDLFYKQINILNVGNTQKFISLTNIRNLIINHPSIEEQTKISQFFQTLDNKIDLQTKKVEQYKNFKKAMLQKMFV